MPIPPQDGARILFLIFCFWLFTSGGSGGGGLFSSPWLPSLVSTRLARQRQAHGVLNSTRWGDFRPRAPHDPPELQPSYLDLVGFREIDGYAWDDLEGFRTRCLELSRHANPAGADGGESWDAGTAAVPVWQNATGIVSGEWLRRDGSVPRTAAAYNLTQSTPGVTWDGGRAVWSLNVTGQNGRVLLRLEEEKDHLVYGEEAGIDGPRSGGMVRTVSVLATIQDEESGGMLWDMRLHGVHWPRKGAMLVATTSEKFAGIFGLPHLTPGPDFFRSSQALLNGTLDAILRRRERNSFSEAGNSWTTGSEGSSDDDVPSPHCEYIMYLQVHPVNADQLKLKYLEQGNPERLSAYMTEIENELRHPTGAPLKAIPKLRLSFVAWSPDCSFSLETKGPPFYPSDEGEHLVGMKDEMLIHEGRFWILAFAAVQLAQMQLLKGQMKESSTPSTLGRVNFYTAGTMVFADSLIFVASFSLGMSSTHLFLPSLVLALAAFISVMVGSVFVSDVYKIQEPERRHRHRAREQTTQAHSSASTATTPPIIIPSDQDVDAEILENATVGAAALPLPATATNPNTANTLARFTPFTSISGRFALLGIVIIFLSIAATSWPTRLRAAYANTLAAVYLSMWVPQIWRNVQRNSRRAFAWRFMLGQSALRLLPVAYVYLRRADDNVLFTRPDPRAFAVLAAWVWVQLWALAFQDVLGPRFGIPDSWAPHAWDYHPVLREDMIEAGGLPIGLVLGGSTPSSPASTTTHARTRTLSLDALIDGDADDEHDARARRRDRHKETEREHASTCVRSMDCAICREVLEVPVVRAGAEDPAASGGVAGLLQRRSYMVTPCRHIFHASCLEGWLRYRLQCPICREELPPL